VKATRNLLMTLTAMAAVGLAAGTAPANLVAHYPLDTIAGGTTPDSTGGTAGTLNGTGITQAGTGVIGDSFDFSGGTAQYVGIPNHPWGTTAFTTSVWFNPDSLGNQGPVADWTNGGASPQTFLVRTSGSTLQTYVRSGGTQVGGNVSFPSETLTTSDFNHVVLTYDGQRARTYLNGELSTTVHNFGSAKTIGNGSTADIAAIGGRGSSEQDLAGLVDDVAFWNVTLTDGKAAALTNLAKQAALNYDAAQADQLFEVFDGAASDVHRLQDVEPGHGPRRLGRRRGRPRRGRFLPQPGWYGRCFDAHGKPPADRVQDRRQHRRFAHDGRLDGAGRHVRQQRRDRHRGRR